MIGIKRRTTKFAVLAIVLAAGGSGVYYFTSGAGAPWIRKALGGEANAAATKTGGDSAASLEAVASAWAERDSARPSKLNEPSASARSADVTLAKAPPNSASPSRYNRYREMQLAPAASAVTPIPPSTPTSAESQSPPSSDVAGTETVPEAADAIKPSRYQMPLTALDPPKVESPAPEAASLVRGQDPGDEKAATAEAVAEIPAVSKTTADANALRLPDEGPAANPNLSAAAARARQAFNEPTPPATGDRYRMVAEQARPTEAAAGASTPKVNPFAMAPAQAQTAATPAIPSTQSPLSTSKEPATATADYSRPPEPNRFTPADYGSTPGNYGGAMRRSTGGPADMFGSARSPSDDNSSQPEGAGRPGERALEGAQNPALVIQKLGPPEIQVGKPAKFVIQVRNVGSQAAAEVVIQDEVPQGTRLLSTSPPAEVSGGRLQWRFGALSIGEERSIELQLMPTAEGDIGSVATVSYSAQASIKTRSTMPQLAIKMTAPKQVMVGQEQRVKILLNNPGSGDASGVMLFENVPENVRHAAGAALEFEIGTLRAGETRELELVLLAQKPGKVVNILSARAEGNLQVQQQVEFEIIAPALTVAVVGPERRYLERPATYEVRVENPGTATARDIQLVTKLPKGMKFVRANNMGEYDANTHAVYWSLAELPEGEKGSVELVAMPIETGAQTLEVEGRAQQGLADKTKQQILVEGLAAIMFEVRDLEDPIEVGRETTYEIRVVNQGTKAATNVQVAVALPPGLQFLSAEGETRHAAQKNGIVFAPIKELAPKADTLYRLKLQCRAAGDQRVTVEVKTDDLTQPIRREESTRVFGDE